MERKRNSRNYQEALKQRMEKYASQTPRVNSFSV
jgi:hypothetical protein